LGGRSAFTADSRGYISSRLDLNALAGQDVRFRFRIGTDAVVYDYGWFIDDVRIYTCESASNMIYLPLVLKNVSGSLLNGDFESGPINWTEFSSNGWELILQDSAMPNPVYAHSGIWAVWLGGSDDEISYIEQTVTVPPASPHFTYWHWIDSEDACGSDYGAALVNGSTIVDVYNLCSAENTSGWVLHSVDLSAYAGQTIALQIRVETDEAWISNVYVDDVSFESSPAPPSFIASPGYKVFAEPKSNYPLKRSEDDIVETPRVFRP
jgi:hypothetical protein